MIPDFPYPDAVNPFVSQTPTQILEREFESDQFSITGTTSELFLVYPPPQFNEASFLAALSTFRYLRWKKIRWRIQGACSPFVYGWFGLTCLPNVLPTRGNTLSFDFGYLSHCDSVVVDMSSASETIIEVPWLFNTEWLDIDRLNYSSSVGPHAYANIQNLNGLKLMYLFQNMHSLNSTVPASYTGSIFCKMIGAEVAGPRAYRLPVGPSKVEYQMFGAAASYAAGKVAEHVIPAAKKNFDKFVEQGTAQSFSAASDWVSSFMTTEETLPDAPLTQEKSSESSNIIPNVYGSMNISPSVNVLGQGTNVISAGKARKHSILKELQKPSFILTYAYAAATGIVAFHPNSFLSGLPPTTTDTVVQRSCSRLQFFGSMHRWWRGSINYTFVFISSPMVIWKLKMTMVYGIPSAGPSSSSIVGDVIGDVVTVKGTTTHTITVPYLASNPWSATHTSNWEANDPVDTTGEIVPTILLSTLMPPISSGDQLPLLYVLIFENAGPDFKFASPQELRNVSASGVEYQMRVADLCSVRAPAQGSPYVDRFAVDSVMNVEDLAKKWSVRQDQALRGPEPYGASSDSIPSDLSMLDGLSTLYFYWRGQIKFKLTIDPTYGEMIPPTASIVAKVFPSYLFTNSSTVTVDSQRFGDGCHVISSGLTQCMTLTLPFTSNAEYLSTLDDLVSTYDGSRWLGSLGAANYQYLAYIYTDGSDISLPIAWLAVAAGDDFSFAYPMPPPYGGFRWYNATPPDSRSSRPLIEKTKSAGFKHDPLVRPMDSVSLETSELLTRMPLGVRRLTSLETGSTVL